MFFFLIAGITTICLLAKHRKPRMRNSWTQTEAICIDKSTQTSTLMDVCSPPTSDFFDPFDIDYNFFLPKHNIKNS